MFHTFLQSPKGSYLLGIKDPNISNSKNSVLDTSSNKLDDILTFPSASKAMRENAVRMTADEFHLNTDQKSVLTLVSRWFISKEERGKRNIKNVDMRGDIYENRIGNHDEIVNGNEMENQDKRGKREEEKEEEEEISDIILVHGVFGSGKSHLLASVCVLLKRLSAPSSSSSSSSSTSSSSASSSTSSQSLYDESRSTGSIGVKRTLGGGGPGKTGCQPTIRSTPCRLKCLLSANTNVAVDRVLVQLAKRGLQSPKCTFNDQISNNCDNTSNEFLNNSTSAYVNKENKLSNHYVTNSLQDEQHTVNPIIARVGCVAKIDRYLRKHYVLQSENRTNALREVTRLLKTDSDPQLIRLANDTKKADFSSIQNKMIIDADVIGVTCASAGNVLLKDMRCHVLILDEASQMTEPLSLLPMACGQPLFMLIVGDSKQLPPTLANTSNSTFIDKEIIEEDVTSHLKVVKSNNVDDENASNFPFPLKNEDCTTLARTLFDRLQAIGWPCITLRTQYRCHPVIAQVCR